MGNKLSVGNLNFTTTEDALKAAFAANGRSVKEVAIPSDRETGRPRGFAIVTMGSDADAQDKPQRSGGGGYGGGGGGRGGGGGGGRERW